MLFDVFGTLLLVDAHRLPTVVVDGQPVRSTLGGLEPTMRRVVPGISAVALFEALRSVTREMITERGPEHRESPSRDRFHRALTRLGLAVEEATYAAVTLSRAHLAVLADATVVPAEHVHALSVVARSRRVGIVSNFDDTATLRMLLERHALLPLVHSVVVSESLGVRKPNPTLIRVGLDELGVSAPEALVVGDTFAEDVAAAQAAGVDAAWIDAAGAGVPPGAEAPSFTLGSLGEIEAILAPT